MGAVWQCVYGEVDHECQTRPLSRPSRAGNPDFTPRGGREEEAIFNIDQWFMVLDKQRFIDCSPIYRSLFDFLFLSLYF